MLSLVNESGVIGRLMKLGEVAALLSVSRRSVERLIARGELSRSKIGRSLRVPESAVMSYIEQNTKRSPTDDQVRASTEAS